MSLSNYLEPRLLDLVVNNATFPAIVTVWGSLHTADPTETGTGSPLASTPRSQIVFNATSTASGRTNATTVNWVCSATGGIGFLALWDGSATATANCLVYGALNATKTVANVGATVQLASAALTVTFS